MKAGMVQRQSAGVQAIIVFQCGGQLLQNHGQVFLGGLYRYGLRMLLGLLYMIFHLDDICKGVEVAFQFKRFFDQFLRIITGSDGIGLDHLLTAVEVLHNGFRGDLQSECIHGQDHQQCHSQ